MSRQNRPIYSIYKLVVFTFCSLSSNGAVIHKADTNLDGQAQNINKKMTFEHTAAGIYRQDLT